MVILLDFREVENLLTTVKLLMDPDVPESPQVSARAFDVTSQVLSSVVGDITGDHYDEHTDDQDYEVMIHRPEVQGLVQALVDELYANQALLDLILCKGIRRVRVFDRFGTVAIYL